MMKMQSLGFMLVLLLAPVSGLVHPTTRQRYRSTASPLYQTSFGIPTTLDTMEVGQSFRQESLVIEKVSARPPIFVLRGVLGKEDCETIMRSASRLEPARTLSAESDDDMYRKSCSVCWLANDEDSRVRSIANKCHSILMPNQIFDAERGVESLQVVRYETKGEYVLHHDSNKRFLTVLYYLNGKGETWFPLADSHDGPSPRNRY